MVKPPAPAVTLFLFQTNRTIHSAYYGLPAADVASPVSGLKALNTSVLTNFDMNVLGNFRSSLPAQRKTGARLPLLAKRLSIQFFQVVAINLMCS